MTATASTVSTQTWLPSALEGTGLKTGRRLQILDMKVYPANVRWKAAEYAIFLVSDGTWCIGARVNGASLKKMSAYVSYKPTFFPETLAEFRFHHITPKSYELKVQSADPNLYLLFYDVTFHDDSPGYKIGKPKHVNESDHYWRALSREWKSTSMNRIVERTPGLPSSSNSLFDASLVVEKNTDKAADNSTAMDIDKSVLEGQAAASSAENQTQIPVSNGDLPVRAGSQATSTTALNPITLEESHEAENADMDITIEGLLAPVNPADVASDSDASDTESKQKEPESNIEAPEPTHDEPTTGPMQEISLTQESLPSAAPVADLPHNTIPQTPPASSQPVSEPLPPEPTAEETQPAVVTEPSSQTLLQSPSAPKPPTGSSTNLLALFGVLSSRARAHQTAAQATAAPSSPATAAPPSQPLPETHAASNPLEPASLAPPVTPQPKVIPPFFHPLLAPELRVPSPAQTSSPPPLGDDAFSAPPRSPRSISATDAPVPASAAAPTLDHASSASDVASAFPTDPVPVALLPSAVSATPEPSSTSQALPPRHPSPARHLREQARSSLETLPQNPARNKRPHVSDDEEDEESAPPLKKLARAVKKGPSSAKKAAKKSSIVAKRASPRSLPPTAVRRAQIAADVPAARLHSPSRPDRSLASAAPSMMPMLSPTPHTNTDYLQTQNKPSPAPSTARKAAQIVVDLCSSDSSSVSQESLLDPQVSTATAVTTPTASQASLPTPITGLAREASAAPTPAPKTSSKAPAAIPLKPKNPGPPKAPATAASSAMPQQGPSSDAPSASVTPPKNKAAAEEHRREAPPSSLNGQHERAPLATTPTSVRMVGVQGHSPSTSGTSPKTTVASPREEPRTPSSPNAQHDHPVPKATSTLVSPEKSRRKPFFDASATPPKKSPVGAPPKLQVPPLPSSHNNPVAHPSTKVSSKPAALTPQDTASVTSFDSSSMMDVDAESESPSDSAKARVPVLEPPARLSIKAKRHKEHKKHKKDKKSDKHKHKEHKSQSSKSKRDLRDNLLALLLQK